MEKREEFKVSIKLVDSRL